VNEELLYDNDRCRLCGLDGRDHTDECPGRFIDAAQYEVTYSGANWGRTGETEGYDRADTLEDAIRAAGVSLADSGVAQFRAEARVIADIEVVTAQVKLVYNTVIADRRAKDDAKKVAAQRARSLAALEAMRADLTPWAYQRRLAAINASTDGRGEP
jgi:hypothetical protein